MRASTSTRSGGRPISSWVSRSAVNSSLASPGSARPPGKLTWPECARSCAVRCVKSTVRPVPCVMMGTSTEAGVFARIGVQSSRVKPGAGWPIFQFSKGYLVPGTKSAA